MGRNEKIATGATALVLLVTVTLGITQLVGDADYTVMLLAGVFLIILARKSSLVRFPWKHSRTKPTA